MSIHEYIEKTRQLETTHPQPINRTWYEVRKYYRNLCREWLKELSYEDIKELKRKNPTFRPWGLDI